MAAVREVESDGFFDEDEAIEALGYKHELKRRFSLWGTIGFCLNMSSTWLAISAVLVVGVTYGGPPVMIWSWIAISFCAILTSTVFAEMCSAFPIAGGQYSWVALVAPPTLARPMSYFTGYFLLIAIIAVAGLNSYITGLFTMSMVNIMNPDFVIQPWQQPAVGYAVSVFVFIFNIAAPSIWDRVSWGILIWNIVSFLTISITILATTEHKRDASFVFFDFINMSGWEPGYAVLVCLLQGYFSFPGFDAPAHIIEEIRDSRRNAPKAIVAATSLTALLGFVFLIVLCFCMGDIEGLANTTTQLPISQILLDSTKSRPASTALVFLIFVISVAAGNNFTTEGSRVVYAFARDRGLPFSDFLAKVQTNKRLPINALVVTFVGQLVFLSISLGPSTGFLTLSSIGAVFFYIAYLLPMAARLMQPRRRLEGPYCLGNWSVPANVVGVVFIMVGMAAFFLPTETPVTTKNFNYTCAAFVIVALAAIVWWFARARKVYKGPAAVRQMRARVQERSSSGADTTEAVSVPVSKTG